ncbi:MAG: hypothetical protein WCG23_01700 [bacterium]
MDAIRLGSAIFLPNLNDKGSYVDVSKASKMKTYPGSDIISFFKDTDVPLVNVRGTIDDIKKLDLKA